MYFIYKNIILREKLIGKKPACNGKQVGCVNLQ